MAGGIMVVEMKKPRGRGGAARIPLEPMPPIDEVKSLSRDINPRDVVLLYDDLVGKFTGPLRRTFNKMERQSVRKRAKNTMVSDEFFKGQASILTWAIGVIGELEREIKKSKKMVIGG
jgi:hypothetical protein